MGIDLGRFRSKNNDEWLDWLSDDPVPASFRERMRMGRRAPEAAARPTVRRPGRTPQPVKTTENNAKSVNIHISIPALKLKKPTLPKKLPKLPKNLTYKQLGVGMGALALVMVIGVSGMALHSKGAKSNKPDSTGVLGASSQKPTFAYNLPSGPNHQVQPTDVKFDSQHKVVNFKDSIGGVDITVSQQPLPDSFKSDPQGQVKKLAEGFSATKAISTSNPTAYLGTSVKGPQTVIFTKKDLLVFIQSTKNIDEHDWAGYITSLQ